jgi:hypothetical protein
MCLWEIIVLIVFIQIMLFLFINFVLFRETPKKASSDIERIFQYNRAREYYQARYGSRYQGRSRYHGW